MNEAVSSANHPALKPDHWLSAIFGYPVWRVVTESDGLSLSTLQQTSPVFAYAKLDVRQVADLASLTDAGFRVVDTALTFTGTVEGETGSHARFAIPTDRAQVEHIAGSAFRYSRFHLDPLVPAGLADAIKSSWAGNFFEGKRGDAMVVVEREKRVVGFLQLLRGPGAGLVIDLIGVDPPWQGQGLGREMILHAALHGVGDGVVPTSITVGTQAANRPSARLYESLGMRLSAAQYVAHHHGSRSPV